MIGKASRRTELLDTFERTARTRLGGIPELKDSWSLARTTDCADLRIAASSSEGFEVGATCETYGLYPFAGPWQGAPWEPGGWSIEQLCDGFLGLVRALISPDARLRVVYRRGHLQTVTVELRTPAGWREFEKSGGFVLPFGRTQEVVLQNDRLRSRFPFADLEVTGCGAYRWEGGST